MNQTRFALFMALLMLIPFQGDALASGPGALKVLPPSVGAYHGAYTDFGATEDVIADSSVLEFEKLSGKGLAWVLSSNHWLDGVIKFPQANVEMCRRLSKVCYIRIQPWSTMSQGEPDPIFSMAAIIAGNFDGALRVWAQQAKLSGVPLMLEFGPEVNGNWFPWNGKWNGGKVTDRYGDPTVPDGPERFRDAYRHVIDLFRSEGVTNVTWVIHVDANWVPHAEWNKFKHYYPGDEYIDWIGVSVFGAQLPTHKWRQFAPILEEFWPQIDEVSTGKPVLISEYGVIERSRDASGKAEWLAAALQSISEGDFPRIKGVTYWHSPGWLENGEASFRIDSSLRAKKAYQAEIAKPFWLDTAVLGSQR